ncbi:MAG: chromosome segregation protein SMC, partial [Thermodesulfobacteriota bacterium]
NRAVRAQAELVLRGQRIDKDIRSLDLQARQQETRIGQEEGRLAIYQQELTERSVGVRALRENLRKLEAEALQAGVSLSEIRLKRDHLAQDVAERYQMDLGLAYGDLIDRELNEPAAREELAALKDALEKLGPVNPEAVTEYEELTDRRSFLEAQVADLTASLEDLRSAIRKINQTTLARFMETFRSVAAKMEEICPILFGEGAQAQLVLLEPDKPLESGLDLKVQPPGKRLTSLSLLSGGEKALAAACLLFAIFLNRPTPFCLLDEVDAPLDEANVERFNKLLREIGRHSQILMITHKQRTMEVVDSLFGVTMPEPGVSRLVSVKLDRPAAAAETLMEK